MVALWLRISENTSNEMNEVHRLLAEITQLTSRIETDYPELYRMFDENPVTLPVESRPIIDAAILEDYLETITLQMMHHIEALEQRPRQIVRK